MGRRFLYKYQRDKWLKGYDFKAVYDVVFDRRFDLKSADSRFSPRQNRSTASRLVVSTEGHLQHNTKVKFWLFIIIISLIDFLPLPGHTQSPPLLYPPTSRRTFPTILIPTSPYSSSDAYFASCVPQHPRGTCFPPPPFIRDVSLASRIPPVFCGFPSGFRVTCEASEKCQSFETRFLK